jgi:hypothetical protein
VYLHSGDEGSAAAAGQYGTRTELIGCPCERAYLTSRCRLLLLSEDVGEGLGNWMFSERVYCSISTTPSVTGNGRS